MKKFKILSVVLMLVLGVMCFSACKFNFDRTPTYKILSNSMAPALLIGDKVEVKEKDNYILGDIIAFNFNEHTVIHRIIYIIQEDGVTYYICKGDSVQNLDGSDSDGEWIDDKETVYSFISFDDATIEELKNQYGPLIQVITEDQILGVAEKIEK